MSKIKNIIIFTVIAAALILIYIFFIKKAPDQGNLISSNTSGIVSGTNTSTSNTSGQNSLITKDLLSVLLSVKNIKLDDAIFSDEVFVNLHDSSILLNAPNDEGRANPFAPIGFEKMTALPTTSPISIIPSTVVTPDNSSLLPIVPSTTTKITSPAGSEKTTKTPTKNPKTP